MSARLTLAATAALALASVSVAHAADAPPPDAAAVSVTTDRDPRNPLSLRASATYDAGGRNASISYRRGSVGAGIGYDGSRHLSLYLDVRYGTTMFGYRGSMEDGLKLDTELWSRLDVSAAFGGSYLLMRRGPWWLSAYGEVETSVVNSPPTLERLDAATPQGSFSLEPYGERMSSLTSSWYRVTVGAVAGRSFALPGVGHLEPHLGLGFELLSMSLDAGLNPDSRETLSLLGHDPGLFEDPHNATLHDVMVMPGINLRLNAQDTVSLEGRVSAEWPPGSFGIAPSFIHRFH